MKRTNKRANSIEDYLKNRPDAPAPKIKKEQRFRSLAPNPSIKTYTFKRTKNSSYGWEVDYTIEHNRVEIEGQLDLTNTLKDKE